VRAPHRCALARSRRRTLRLARAGLCVFVAIVFASCDETVHRAVASEGLAAKACTPQVRTLPDVGRFVSHIRYGGVSVVASMRFSSPFDTLRRGSVLSVRTLAGASLAQPSGDFWFLFPRLWGLGDSSMALVWSEPEPGSTDLVMAWLSPKNSSAVWAAVRNRSGTWDTPVRLLGAGALWMSARFAVGPGDSHRSDCIAIPRNGAASPLSSGRIMGWR